MTQQPQRLGFPPCDSCAVAGEQRPATTRSRHPDYRGYYLCAGCATEYDAEFDRAFDAWVAAPFAVRAASWRAYT